MSEKEQDGHSSAEAPPSYAFTPWKKGLCLAALCMMLGGGALTFLGPSSKGVAVKQERPAQPAGAGQAFLPEGFPAPEGQAAGREATPWGPALLQGGAGFLIGFSIGYALRTVLRMVVVLLGLLLLGLAAMQYAGWIHIEWGVVESQINQGLEALKAQFRSFSDFISGAVPAAGLAGFGLFVGLRRR